ncbi:MAG: hypothetical protein Pg6C_09410 [Treponemataceae bacterium]|nr:MAG: hypothetical protein Pg6C_09410 [Treponemataceae bacterium]
MLNTTLQNILPAADESLSVEKRGDLRLKIIIEILIEFIYHSPTLFECRDFQDDEKCGFLLAVYRALPKLIANYDESKGKFLTYLVTYVRMIAKGYRRTAAKARAAEDSIEYWCRFDYLKGLEAREEEPEYIAERRTDERRGRFPKVAEKTLIVLAVKNSYSITEKQISFIAGFTGFNRGKLNDIIEKARNSLKQREEGRRKLIESRNHAFVQKTRRRIEMERLAPESAQYALVQKQYNFYSALLEKRNHLLKTKFKLMPSNKYIGDALDIPPRNVKRILDDAERTFYSVSHRLMPKDCVV